MRNHLTLHSIKRGAAEALWAAAAVGKIPTERIPTVLKHKSALNDVIPDLDVLYAPNPTDLALATGQSKLTTHLAGLIRDADKTKLLHLLPQRRGASDSDTTTPTSPTGAQSECSELSSSAGLAAESDEDDE